MALLKVSGPICHPLIRQTECLPVIRHSFTQQLDLQEAHPFVEYYAQLFYVLETKETKFLLSCLLQSSRRDWMDVVVWVCLVCTCALCVVLSGVYMCMCMVVSGVYMCMCVVVSGVYMCMCVVVSGVYICMPVCGGV